MALSYQRRGAKSRRQGHVLDILEHPNQQRYGGQRIFVVQRDDYLYLVLYLVPFVEDDGLIAPKTIIPSRKATKQYAVSGDLRARPNES
jgi:hypothetical protein